MKKFIFKILIFTLPIILSSYLLDIFISKTLKKSNFFAKYEYPTWNAIVNGKLNSDILVYGSSRAWVQFDPKIIEDSLKLPAYNIGIDGHCLGLQYLRHTISLKYNKKPKMIIHSVDVGTLVKENLYNSDQFLPYMLWSNDFSNEEYGYKGYSYLDYKIPLIRYYGKLEAIKTAVKLTLFPNNNPIKRVKGYQGQDTPWNNDFDKAKKAMKKYRIKIDPATVKVFDKYLKECRDKKIEVILVFSPMYIEGQEFIVNKDEIIKIYKMFSKKYGISFMDFTKDEICFDKKYFYNASHMNKTGSELFTRKLCSLIKNRNLQ